MEISGLIVGLGNPGKEYELTRHNFGFMVVDAFLAGLASGADTIAAKKAPYELWRAKVAGGVWLFAKPLTYMNKSGEAVAHILHYYKVQPESVVSLHDEVDIPFGRMKMKCGGGNAGHNGLKSLQQHLGTPNFHRIRLGVGKPLGFDTASYVLARFSQEERTLLPALMTEACDVLYLHMQGKQREAQTRCNSFALPGVAP